MGAFFLGVLRSGSRDAVRAALSGLDADVTFIPADFPDPGVEPAPYVPQPSSVDWHGAPGYLRLIIQQTWPEAAWEHAATIASGESGFDPGAHNTNGEDSRGIWQINVVPQANADLLYLGDMFDPNVNARAAFIVWQRQGWVAWLNVATRLGVPLTGPGIP